MKKSKVILIKSFYKNLKTDKFFLSAFSNTLTFPHQIIIIICANNNRKEVDLLLDLQELGSKLEELESKLKKIGDSL